MSKFKSEFLRSFAERGAYYDCSGPEELDKLFASERVTTYIGFDCTADSLHVGSLVQLMTLRRLQQSDGLATMWLAEADGQVVSAGRLEIVPDTEFAGLWGGATRQQWRGKGIYRAMTAARARYARDHGVRYLQSDCTEMSRPILERSGLRRITTTTPYVWKR